MSRRLKRMCVKCGTTIQVNVSCSGFCKERDIILCVCGLCAENGFFNSTKEEVLTLPLKRNKTTTNWLTHEEFETEGMRCADRRFSYRHRRRHHAFFNVFVPTK